MTSGHPTELRALTLTQPWATLVAIGAKRFETRSWRTNYRGPLAIHAGAGLGPVGGIDALCDLCDTEPFRSALAEHGLRATRLPRGVIIAVCELVEVLPAEEAADALRYGAYEADEYVDDTDRAAAIRELAFGDYTPGRYAWLLENVSPLDNPIVCRGKLGLWTTDLVPDVAALRG